MARHSQDAGANAAPRRSIAAIGRGRARSIPRAGPRRWSEVRVSARDAALRLVWSRPPTERERNIARARRADREGDFDAGLAAASDELRRQRARHGLPAAGAA